MSWVDLTKISSRPLWRRSDGATVRWDNGPSKLHWIAFEPDPSEKYLMRCSKRGLGFPRHWADAKSAMRAVDREFPESLRINRISML
jgi:hypothetical protein